MQRPLFSFLTASILLALTFSAFSTASSSPPKYLTYRGQLLDHTKNAVSGIYRLHFSLHESPTSTKKVWKEPHEVAISNGVYKVMLGYQTSLPKRNFERFYLAVSLAGGPELVREPVSSLLTKNAMQKSQQKNRKTTKTKQTNPAGTNYVPKADRAEFATEAGNSARFEGRTLDEVAKYVHEKTGIKRIRVGKGRPNNDHIGGNGGGEFVTRCPSGYVVVGIQGYAGRYMDGFDLLCAPLKLD